MLITISQVCSGDILQFGVDVMENSRKVAETYIYHNLRSFEERS